MKKSVHIIIALAIGLLLGSATNVFAAIGDVVEAQFAEFVFKVDGEEKTLDADPLVYQGTTYLPVRTVANLLGKDVVYKADSRTIELNSPVVIQTKEANTIVQDANKMQIESELKTINYQIDNIKQVISRFETDLNNPNFTDDMKKTVELSISHFQKNLSDLEARKAELEAQLQQTP